jgi:flagellin-like protein
MITKRGISPLIATVLLVGFTIAMATMVTTFLMNKTQEEFDPESIIKDSEFCDSVSLGYTIDSIGEPDGLRLDDPGGIYGFKLKNKGAFTITNVTVSVNGNTRDPQSLYDYEDSNKIITLKPKKSTELRIFGSPTFPEKLEVIPWVKDPRDEVFVICPGKKLVINLKDVAGVEREGL